MKFKKPLLNFSLLLLSLIILFGIFSLFESEFRFKKKHSRVVKEFGILIPKGNYIHGIDVSKHQGIIDWKRVSEMRAHDIKIDFAFIKATEGITRTDHNFKKNWKGAGKNNIIRGAYHFYYPSRDAKKQAQSFIETVELIKGDLPPVIDIELDNGRAKKTIVEDLKLMCNELESHYGIKPIIYTNLHFYETYLKDDFNQYTLWISCYFDQKRFEKECDHKWTFWQHSEKGKVDGISGNVDFNVYNGTLTGLNKMRMK